MRRLVASLTLATLLITATPAHAGRYYEPDAPACFRLAKMARSVGWPRRELKELRRIAARESHCSFAAYNPKDPHGGSFCALQINGSWAGYLKRTDFIKTSMRELHNPQKCLRAGLHIFDLYGWTPWRGSST